MTTMLRHSSKGIVNCLDIEDSKIMLPKVERLGWLRHNKLIIQIIQIDKLKSFHQFIDEKFTMKLLAMAIYWSIISLKSALMMAKRWQ